MRVRRWWAVLGMVTVFMLGAVACGSDDGGSSPAGGSSPTGGATGGAADATITVRDFEFDPPDVTIPSGGTIQIRSEGSATHSFTMNDGSVTQDIEPGSTVTVTVPTAGPFHCRFHSQMTGTVTFG
jgi:cytochrome c oxidase subunit 2